MVPSYCPEKDVVEDRCRYHKMIRILRFADFQIMCLRFVCLIQKELEVSVSSVSFLVGARINVRFTGCKMSFSTLIKDYFSAVFSI